MVYKHKYACVLSDYDQIYMEIVLPLYNAIYLQNNTKYCATRNMRVLFKKNLYEFSIFPR